MATTDRPPCDEELTSSFRTSRALRLAALRLGGAGGPSAGAPSDEHHGVLREPRLENALAVA
jgi:hypothetical protein